MMRAEVGGGRSDEMETRLGIIVDSDGVREGPVRVIREETVRKGQRYRLGGRFLIPIDAQEDVTAPEVEVRARATREIAATLNGAPEEGRKLRFIVFVDARGKMHSCRRLPSKDLPPASAEMVAAATRALKDWEFEAAKAGSLSVADYLMVEVVVRP